MLIMNASSEEQHLKVFGNHFTLKPGQIRDFQDEIARFMAMERGYLGVVGLPDEFSDLAYRESDEGKSRLEEFKEAGVTNRVRFLQSIINNELIGLKSDLDKANLKQDPRTLMDPKMVKQMRELASYQARDEDAEKARVADIKKLEEKLKKNLTPSDRSEILKDS